LRGQVENTTSENGAYGGVVVSDRSYRLYHWGGKIYRCPDETRSNETYLIDANSGVENVVVFLAVAMQNGERRRVKKQ